MLPYLFIFTARMGSFSITFVSFSRWATRTGNFCTIFLHDATNQDDSIMTTADHICPMKNKKFLWNLSSLPKQPKKTGASDQIDRKIEDGYNHIVPQELEHIALSPSLSVSLCDWKFVFVFWCSFIVWCDALQTHEPLPPIHPSQINLYQEIPPKLYITCPCCFYLQHTSLRN